MARKGLTESQIAESLYEEEEELPPYSSDSDGNFLNFVFNPPHPPVCKVCKKLKTFLIMLLQF
jgi:hypothetical protein